MSAITIRKVRDPQDVALPFFQDIQNLLAEIRQRAFAQSEKRSSGQSLDMDDWLRAESEVVWVPPAELLEREEDFLLRIGAPGFGPADIEIAVMPGTIIVKGECKHTHETERGDVRFSEFEARKLLRRVDLPSEIDVDGTSATLNNGILEIVSAKAT